MYVQTDEAGRVMATSVTPMRGFTQVEAPPGGIDLDAGVWHVADGAAVLEPVEPPITLDDVIEYMTDIDLRVTMQELGL